MPEVVVTKRSAAFTAPAVGLGPPAKPGCGLRRFEEPVKKLDLSMFETKKPVKKKEPVGRDIPLPTREEKPWSSDSSLTSSSSGGETPPYLMPAEGRGGPPKKIPVMTLLPPAPKKAIVMAKVRSERAVPPPARGKPAPAVNQLVTKK